MKPLLVEHKDQPGVIAIVYPHEDDASNYSNLTIIAEGSTSFARRRFPAGYDMAWSKKKNWKRFAGRIEWSNESGELKMLTHPSNNA